MSITDWINCVFSIIHLQTEPVNNLITHFFTLFITFALFFFIITSYGLFLTVYMWGQIFFHLLFIMVEYAFFAFFGFFCQSSHFGHKSAENGLFYKLIY